MEILFSSKFQMGKVFPSENVLIKKHNLNNFSKNVSKEGCVKSMSSLYVSHYKRSLKKAKNINHTIYIYI